MIDFPADDADDDERRSLILFLVSLSFPFVCLLAPKGESDVHEMGINR